jgi:predicted RND superfamily exporter protein
MRIDGSTLPDRITNLLVRWRWPVLLLAAAVSIAAYFVAQQMRFDRSIENMFAADDPLLDPFRKLKRTFGGDEIVLAAYVDPNLLTASGMDRLENLSDKLGEVDGVRAAVSLANVPLVDPTMQRDNSDAYELFEGYLIDKDRQTTAVVCVLDSNTEADSRSATIDQMRDIVTRHDQQGVLAGEPVMVVDGFDYVEEDGRRLQTTSTLLLMLVIVLCFRSLRWVAIPIVIVHATMLWTEATLVLAQFKLSMVSSMLAAIITVIGVATVIQLVVEIRDQRQHGLFPRKALIAAGAVLMTPIFWRALTDVAGFGSLLAARAGPVQDFGTMMSVGSVMVLATIAMILPGLALWGRIDADPRRAWGEQNLDVGLRKLVDELLHRPRLYGALSLLISLAISLGCLWLDVETDFTRNFRSDSPIVRSYEFVESRLGGAGVWDVILPAPEQIDLSYLKKVRNLQKRLRQEVTVVDEQGNEVPGLTKVLSLVDAIDANPVSIDRVPAFMRGGMLAGMLRMVDQQMPAIAESLRGEDPQQPGSHYYRIMLRARERQPSDQKQRLIDQVRSISQEEFPQAQVTGFFVLLTNIINSMIRDQWVTFAIATGSICLMMWFALASLRLSLVSLVPNVVPILMVTGLMGWLGLRINMGTAMIASVSLGLSIDSSTHYLMSFNRLRSSGLSLEDALHASHQTVGRAMIFSTLALIVGFAALVQSQFVPTIYFGALVSLAMLGGLIGNLVMLPLILKLVLPRQGVAKSADTPSRSLLERVLPGR